MRERHQAFLVGAASVMDLSGQTITRWARKRSGSPEHQLALMRFTRRGQTLMFAAVMVGLLAAFVLLLRGASTWGGVVGIFTTVFAFAVSLYVTLRFP